jgi:hypothetical protein
VCVFHRCLPNYDLKHAATQRPLSNLDEDTGGAKRNLKPTIAPTETAAGVEA